MWPEQKTSQSWRGRHNLKVGKGLKNHLLQNPSFPDEGNEAASWREQSRFLKHTSVSNRLSCCWLFFKTPQVWLVFPLPLLSASPLPSPTCILFLFQNEVAYSAISISFLNPTTLWSSTNQTTSIPQAQSTLSSVPLDVFPSGCDALPSLGTQLQMCLALLGRPSSYLCVTIVTTNVLCSVTLMALISSYVLLICLLDFSPCLVYGIFSVSIATLLW